MHSPLNMPMRLTKETVAFGGFWSPCGIKLPLNIPFVALIVSAIFAGFGLDKTTLFAVAQPFAWKVLPALTIPPRCHPCPAKIPERDLRAHAETLLPAAREMSGT